MTKYSVLIPESDEGYGILVTTETIFRDITSKRDALEQFVSVLNTENVCYEHFMILLEDFLSEKNNLI